MVTDEMMDAINMLIEICSNEQQIKGMESMREMLADFDECEWFMKKPSDCREWLEQYLSCKRK